MRIRALVLAVCAGLSMGCTSATVVCNCLHKFNGQDVVTAVTGEGTVMGIDEAAGAAACVEAEDLAADRCQTQYGGTLDPNSCTCYPDDGRAAKLPKLPGKKEKLVPIPDPELEQRGPRPVR